LDKYVRQTGMSYQLVPVLGDGATVDTDAAYKNIMTKFAFGNAKNPNVYFDEENRRHLNSMRLAVAQIAQALVADGKKDSARQVLRKFDSETNERNFPYGMTSNRGNQHNYFSYLFLQASYSAGEYTIAKKATTSLQSNMKGYIELKTSPWMKALTFVHKRSREDAASGSNLRYILDDLDARTGSSSSSAGVGLFDDMADFSFTENLNAVWALSS
jgi:hypothetical protein